MHCENNFILHITFRYITYLKLVFMYDLRKTSRFLSTCRFSFGSFIKKTLLSPPHGSGTSKSDLKFEFVSRVFILFRWSICLYLCTGLNSIPSKIYFQWEPQNETLFENSLCILLKLGHIGVRWTLNPIWLMSLEEEERKYRDIGKKAR